MNAKHSPEELPSAAEHLEVLFNSYVEDFDLFPFLDAAVKAVPAEDLSAFLANKAQVLEQQVLIFDPTDGFGHDQLAQFAVTLGAAARRYQPDNNQHLYADIMGYDSPAPQGWDIEE